jgi:nucleotide-binding universal stress UspA family protein
MHVIVATDGSKQSLAAARHLKSFADPTKISAISVIAVVRPLAAVAFADDLSTVDQRKAHTDAGSFTAAAENAVDVVAAEFDGWVPKVHRKVRSGSPANEIIKAAKQLSAGLVVVAAGGRGISDVVLVGSTAQRVQHYAPCPVLVVRPTPRSARRTASKAGRG